MSSERLGGSLESSLVVKYEDPVAIATIAPTKKNQQWEWKALACDVEREGICDDTFAHTDETEEILNATVGPKIWESEGKIWRQMISRTRATRLDAVNLQHNLDALLKDRQALNHGLCPVRRQLYSHCFDEIIRQVTIDNPDRGLLLLRLRDEIQMTLGAYHTLYESAVAHGRHSADTGYYEKLELMSQIEELEGKTEVARQRVRELRLEVEHTRRRLKERREMDGKRFAEEVQFIKRANQQLKQETESLLDYGKRPSLMLQ
jgi:dynein light intermediate chain